MKTETRDCNEETRDYFWRGDTLMSSNNNGTFSSSHIFTLGNIKPGEYDRNLIAAASGLLKRLKGNLDTLKVIYLDTDLQNKLDKFNGLSLAILHTENMINRAVNGKCNTCDGHNGYYEDVAGDGGSKMWILCEDCQTEDAKMDNNS